MPALANTTNQLTQLVLERARSFALDLHFMPADERGDVDLTGSTITLVVSEQARFGGAAVLTKVADLISPTTGDARLALQAADLDITPRVYDYSVTYVDAVAFSATVMKGEVQILSNTDPQVANVYDANSVDIALRVDTVKVSVNHLRPPDIEIGAVATVPYGTQAGASFRGAYPRTILDLSLPHGPQGLQGVQGERGLRGYTGAPGGSDQAFSDWINDGASATRGSLDAIYASLAEAATKEPIINPGTAGQYFRGDKTWANLDKAAVGLPNVDNTSDANKPVSTAQAAALAAKADLIAGKIDTNQLPALAITDVFAPADQAAMLALTAQRGDVAVRADIGKTFILSTDSPGTLADWKEVPAIGQVQSVAGKTGVVTLAKADVGLGNVDNTSDANKPVSTAQQAALDAKAPLANPTFTGWVQVPTAAVGDSWTTAASTAFVQHGLRPKRASVTATAVQSMVSSTEVLITYSTADFDNDGMWAAGTPNRLTVQEAGLYLVNWTLSFASAAAGSRIGLLKVNGVNVMTETPNDLGVGSGLTFSKLLELAAGDYVQIYQYQSSGAALNTHNQPFPRLEMVRLGA